MAEKYAEEKLEAIINRKLDEKLNSGGFEIMLQRVINKKIGYLIEDKVAKSIKWGGLKIDVKMLPEKKK